MCRLGSLMYKKADALRGGYATTRSDPTLRSSHKFENVRDPLLRLGCKSFNGGAWRAHAAQACYFWWERAKNGGENIVILPLGFDRTNRALSYVAKLCDAGKGRECRRKTCKATDFD